MPAIPALILAERERRAIREALGRWRVEVRFCERGRELASALAAGDVLALITELVDADGAPVAPALWALHEQHPSLRVLLYLPAGKVESDAAAAVAAEIGVGGAVIRDIGDLVAVLGAVLVTARVQSAAEQAWGAVEPLVPPDLRPCVRYALAAGRRHTATVGELVAAYGLSRQRLFARLREERMPTPGALIAWGRILTGAFELDLQGRTIESVALDLGFGSARTMSRMFRRYLGLTPFEARRRGGFRYVAGRFAERLRGGPEPHSSRL